MSQDNERNSLLEGFKIQRFDEVKKDYSRVVTKNGKICHYNILEEQIKKLRPISIIDNNAWVLIYLPTKEYIPAQDGNDTSIYNNYPYFITSKKELWHVKADNLEKDFQLPDLGIGEEVRWRSVDVTTFLENENKVDLKDTFTKIHEKIGNLLELKSIDYQNVLVLWAIGTYFYRIFEYYPYLDFSGSKGSGKTKALSILECLCYNARLSLRITGPNWARIVESLNCTILVDEQEDLLDPKSEHSSNMLKLLNSAFRTNAQDSILIPSRGGSWISKNFDLGVPVALGHITPINDVTEDRAIPMKMLKSTNKLVIDSEVVYEERIWHELRDLLYRSLLDYFDEVKRIKSELFDIENVSPRERNQIWKPIMTLARLFERNGVEGLEESVRSVILETHEIKTITNQSQNSDIQVLELLRDYISKSELKQIGESENQIDWFKQEELLYKIKTSPELSYLSSRGLGRILDRLQIPRQKKNPFNMCVFVNRENLINLCKRYNVDYIALLEQSSLEYHMVSNHSATSAQNTSSEGREE